MRIIRSLVCDNELATPILPRTLVADGNPYQVRRTSTPERHWEVGVLPFQTNVEIPLRDVGCPSDRIEAYWLTELTLSLSAK